MRDERKYWPRQFEEIEDGGVSLLNEPTFAGAVELRPGAKRSLYAVLVESLNSTRALLTRLESGVRVPRNDQREIVRLLYVAARHQRDALVACLELDGLE
jgi:hypothetical protein